MTTSTVALATLPEYTKQTLVKLEAVASTVATVLTLQGNLGAGKTTFMQALAKDLGVKEVVTSPTFVVMRVYETEHTYFTKLVHIDAYRFENPEEVIQLKLDEYLSNPHTLICIEWPERLSGQLPSSYHNLQFKTVDNTTREITYVKN